MNHSTIDCIRATTVYTLRYTVEAETTKGHAPSGRL